MKSTRRVYRWSFEFPVQPHLWRARSLELLRSKARLIWRENAFEYSRFYGAPEILFVSGLQAWYQPVGRVIGLCPNHRNYYTLIHELAHALASFDHGAKFVRCNIDLLVKHGRMNPLHLAVSAGVWGLEV